MKTQKYLAIQLDSPCHEDWAKMQPTEKNRFCDSCQKTVIDFTEMSDEQIIGFFENMSRQNKDKAGNQSLCGRMNQAQFGQLYALEPVQESSYQPSQWRKWAAMLVLSSSLLGSSVQAANTIAPQRYNTELRPTWLDQTAKDSSQQHEGENPEEALVVNQFTGTVFQKIGKQSFPIPNAKVQLFIGNTAMAETKTNAAGEFSLQMPNTAMFMATDNIKLHITADGYASQFESLSRKAILKPVRVFLTPLPVSSQEKYHGGMSFQHYEQRNYKKSNDKNE
jgi:hypothetical protein